MKRLYTVSAIVVCTILSVAAFLQASGIVPAIVPSAVPSANRRGSLTPGGGSGIFQLATSAVAGSAGATVCDDGTGSYGTGVSGCVSAAPLFSQTNSVTDSTTGATTLTGTGIGTATLPANFFAAGTVLHFSISGVYSTTATPGVLTMLTTLGGTTVGSTGAITPISSVTNGVWRLWGDITCRTAGAGGTVIVNTIFETAPSSLSTLTPANASIANTATITINTTVTEAFDVTANFGSAGQSITSTNYVLTSFGGGGGGGGSGALTFISTQNFAGGNSVTFSGISAAFNHLNMKCQARGASAVNNEVLDFQFNGDTGTNYNRQFLSVQNTAVAGGIQTAVTSILTSLIPGANQTASYSGVVTYDIPYYANTNFFKNVMVLNSSPPAGGTSMGEFFVSGTWANTAAINAIKVFIDSGNNAAANSSCSLYGIT